VSELRFEDNKNMNKYGDFKYGKQRLVLGECGAMVIIFMGHFNKLK
jgi:hypothetical protein